MEELKLKPFDFSKFSKRHIVLKFLYLGWNRQGFAIQEDNANTIESLLFDALIKTKLIESRESSDYHRCGRTDKGVSAFSQTISITVRSTLMPGLYEKSDSSASIPTDRELNYCKILNGVLPDDIRIIAWGSVGETFSARFDCDSRTYKYFFPLANLDLKAMQEASSYLIGTHDFRNFCKMDVGNGVVNFTRNISEFSLEELNNENVSNQSFVDKGYRMCVATITGTAFLWHQIRALMTVLLLVGEGRESPTVIQRLLDIEEVPRRPQYGLASEIGLNLYHADYHNVDWQYDLENLNKVISQLQLIWTPYAMKTAMVEYMLQDLSYLFHEKSTSKEMTLASNQARGCLREPNVKVYKPLMDRPTCDSLEERVEHYIKKRRLNESIREKMEVKSRNENTL